MLNLYSFFHLNLMFSSIEEDSREEVIQRCYWPLLSLIERLSIPIGVEASGYTLEVINALDPEWVLKLKQLCNQGKAEFIGSGYAQLIGPLVPAKVNLANQNIGLDVYEELLGLRPEIALVNEQAYSSGLVPIYREAGYRAIIMEWDNPASAHPEWDPNWRFLPQRACGPDGSSLPVIWNLSIPFQKFQRFVHGELAIEDYLKFLGERVSDDERVFALYGNDAEIFDFRPGRFHTEAALEDANEWERIGQLYKALKDDDRFSFIAPREVLGFLDRPGAGNSLHLESPQQPIPVKKQPKYNITRWALTGRADLDINTRCWRVYDALEKANKTSEGDWRELCYLWSSDFRTHITEPRWLNYLERLDAFQKRLEVRTPITVCVTLEQRRAEEIPKAFKVSREGAILEVETATQRVRLNCRRGLAIDGYWNKETADLPLLVTLPHGYFDDIHFGADYYSGHFVFETPGQHKVTDLVVVDPVIESHGNSLCIKAIIDCPFGPVTKELWVPHDRAELKLRYTFDWPSCPNGTLRLAHMTLNPELFSETDLSYHAHNGGLDIEKFSLQGNQCNQLLPVSGLVSANQGLGVTEGAVRFGDDRVGFSVEIDKCSAAVLAHVFYSTVGEKYLCRLIFSAMEMDDTSYKNDKGSAMASRQICICIKPEGLL